MEYLSVFWNKLTVLMSAFLNNPDKVKTVVDIIISIIGGVCAIKGIHWIKGLRDKKLAATFGFWSQLVIKIKLLQKRLNSNRNILNNFYSEDAKQNWRNMSASPDIALINEFSDLAKETLSYITNAVDQMPAYRGWTTDYNQLISFLDDVLYYDIADSRSKFKFTDVCTEEQHKKYVESICAIMNRLIQGIESSQKDLEKKLCKQNPKQKEITNSDKKKKITSSDKKQKELTSSGKK